MKKTDWGFNTKDLDPKVRPQDDFFHYAGGGWLSRTEIPKNESRWGSFMILRHSVDTQLQALAKEIEKKDKVQKGSEAELIRDFLRSGMDTKRRNALGLKPLAQHFKLINSIRSTEDIVPTIAKLEKLGGSGIWGAMVDQDLKNSEKYALYLTQSGLGMSDRDYYLKDDAESKRVRDAYRAHLTNLLKLAKLSDDLEKDMETVYGIEKKLARLAMKKEDLRDVDKTYFKYSISKLTRHTPGIDWKGYFAALGAKCSDIIVMQPNFFKGVATLLRTVPVEDWKTYLRLHLVNSFAGALSESFVKENFAFYGTVMSGMTDMQPLWRRVLRTVSGGLGEAFGKLYVDRHFPPNAKKAMFEMVQDLFTAYETRIKKLEWMSPVTKKKALAKLNQFTAKIGYPDTWKSYRGLDIRQDDYVGNIIRVGEWHTKRELKKLTKKKVDRKEWLMYPQTVNAYYNPPMNDIVFPAGILQPPFFSPDVDDAINYGAIGSVIGHEITHGFDDQGSKFDGHGNRKTWWTEKDRTEFEKKTKVLVNQFNQYRVADGLSVNGQLTLGENIADLGGISIAYDAYQLKLARTGRKEIAGFTPEERFFLGASLFEREHSRPEFQKMQVLTDPHSPALFRVNGPLSNLPEFYEAFGVKRGDTLFRDSKNRAKIW